MDIQTNLQHEFQDQETRQTYWEDWLYSQLATQIVILRNQRGWTQDELARRIGTAQPGISRLEDVNYRGWTLTSLMKIAAAFDIALNVEFIPFSAAISKCMSFDVKALEVESGFSAGEE